MQIPEIIIQEVEEAIRITSLDKALGENQLLSRVLYKATQELKELLTQLFNYCLTVGYCLAHFRRSIIVVLQKLKKGDFRDPKIYRPITLLNIVGKIIDKVLVKQLLYIADAYNLLLRTYIGRRAAASCEYVVHLLLEKIYVLQQMGEEDIVSLLILNVSGAFNNVLHYRLIYYL